MTALAWICVSVVAVIALAYCRAWVNAGPCESPHACHGRAWYWHNESQRGMCGDCCWLAEMDCLDFDRPRKAATK